MSRRLTTGRFASRQELTAWIWREWLCGPSCISDIARQCRVSPATVSKVLDTREGIPETLPPPIKETKR